MGHLRWREMESHLATSRNRLEALVRETCNLRGPCFHRWADLRASIFSVEKRKSARRGSRTIHGKSHGTVHRSSPSVRKPRDLYQSCERIDGIDGLPIRNPSYDSIQLTFTTADQRTLFDMCFMFLPVEAGDAIFRAIDYYVHVFPTDVVLTVRGCRYRRTVA